ncbi:TPA: hypothetical protein HA235_02285 [Candidatus Woesearchaeota archaeon]|nr:hypothetical protein [Candidatus Woesearchaeota archaeon]HIH31512.1 hypothetical protein [Candidatus Woesearchaeota archaeon]HIH54189.1 hypothetical protein [Candidatus Woesearchaeota archaeon]HIJ01133.1 hypothetical protein [Candidatus Woesearchaeota archaeon]HIJ13901.1 hypothetical protein [Candidatus Woesearchaeota archaeon]
MGWISIPVLSKKCELFIEKNPQLKISKFACKKGNFIFYREYVNIQKVKCETADIRICLVKNDKGIESWSVDYMRHTGKWQNILIFRDFDECLNEIKSGKW